MAQESAEPDELLQLVTELEELRHRNLQLQVQKSSNAVQERALKVQRQRETRGEGRKAVQSPK